MIATRIDYDPETHKYEHPRQKLYKLSTGILHDGVMGDHILVSQSVPQLAYPETMAFLCDHVGNVITYVEIDAYSGHIDHDTVMTYSPYQITKLD